jgi:hypothetical protein
LIEPLRPVEENAGLGKQKARFVGDRRFLQRKTVLF